LFFVKFKESIGQVPLWQITIDCLEFPCCQVAGCRNYYVVQYTELLAQTLTQAH
jgi:hypothetical protein